MRNYISTNGLLWVCLKHCRASIDACNDLIKTELDKGVKR
jgi:hypothetical protein